MPVAVAAIEAETTEVVSDIVAAVEVVHLFALVHQNPPKNGVYYYYYHHYYYNYQHD